VLLTSTALLTSGF
jgi:hypothetical protein